LHHFEAAAAGNQGKAVLGVDTAARHHPNQLVESIVSPYVLADSRQGAVPRCPRRSVSGVNLSIDHPETWANSPSRDRSPLRKCLASC
jgi:hypothetical protein